ncbi:MAG: sigma-70 family RNA polymerase sigma factor [Oscillospiraceae bacterium]|nr:sigma-70 family RNA polymerase sigma factor [Oscillospiraceae bacterium]
METLTDSEIIALYESRDESAIGETARKYGAYCRAVAMNVLHSREDVEECVNDAYLKVWNAIPPEKPRAFPTFIGRITKNLSLDKYKSRNRQKRGGDDFALILSELEACVPSAKNTENEAESRELERLIDDFLSDISKNDRMFFVRRYWHNDSVADIAERYKVSESKVKSSLFRTRGKLKVKLTKEGIFL